MFKKRCIFAAAIRKIGYAEITDSTLVNAKHFNEVKGYLARVVRDRSAKPGTAVRVRQVPQKRKG